MLVPFLPECHEIRHGPNLPYCTNLAWVNPRGFESRKVGRGSRMRERRENLEKLGGKKRRRRTV